MLRAIRIWEVSTAALFGLAVIAKAWDPTDAVRALGQFGVSITGAYALLCVVVLVEIVLVTRLISLPCDTRTHGAAISLLLVFTGYLVLTRLIVATPAGCGCGSLLSLGAVDGRAQVEYGVSRNLTFLAGFVLARLYDELRWKSIGKGTSA